MEAVFLMEVNIPFSLSGPRVYSPYLHPSGLQPDITRPSRALQRPLSGPALPVCLATWVPPKAGGSCRGTALPAVQRQKAEPVSLHEALSSASHQPSSLWSFRSQESHLQLTDWASALLLRAAAWQSSLGWKRRPEALRSI